MTEAQRFRLTPNSPIVSGYRRQLEIYKEAEETTKGYYLVVDVGGMGKKFEKLLAEKNEAARNGDLVSPIVLVDGSRKPSLMTAQNDGSR